MSISKSVREGEPVRFSLTSRMPIPAPLLTHVRTTFGREFGAFDEHTPQIPGLHSQTLVTMHAARNLEPRDYALVRDELRGPSTALAVDSALLHGSIATTGPRLVVSDMDSTFIRQEVIEMLAAAAGSGERVRAVTDRAMHGELDFAESLRERVATLSGLPESVFSDVASQVTITAGAADLVSAVHARGGIFGIVSGGFHEVVDRSVGPFGVDHILANRLAISKESLSGHTVGPIIDRQAKARALREWADDHSIPPELTVAVGDGANDLGMMEEAGLSVAFCAKPVVRESADTAVTFPRLDALLALFGWNADAE